MKLAQRIDNLIEGILGREVNKGFLQFFRYLICGGMATLADAGLLFLFTHYTIIHYLLAAALSFLVGTLVNYSLNTILVFKSSGEIKRELSVFGLIGIGGLLWTEIIIWILVDKLDLYVMIAKIFAIVFVLNWNFFMRKKFVFSREEILPNNNESL